MSETVTSLQRLYSFILALALTEALKEFSKPRDGSRSTEVGARTSWWFDRGSIFALLTIVFLIVPFFHGMNLYLQATYAPKDGMSLSKGALLLLDIFVFMIEAVFLFLLSRHLELREWRTFYGVVAVLLLIDSVWGFFVFRVHHATTLAWAVVNLATALILFLPLCGLRNYQRTGAVICSVLMIVRTVADYCSSWNFYFG